MMDRLLAFIETTLLPPLAALAENKHLRAVRDGIVAALPLIIIGSFFLLLGQLPVEEAWLTSSTMPQWQKDALAWYFQIQPHLLAPYRVTMKLISIYAAFGIAYHLCRSYKMEGISTGMLSAAAFLVTQPPAFINAAADGAKGPGWVLWMAGLGGEGLFTAILIAFLTVEISRWCTARSFTFKMPEGVPPSVVQAFAALVPGILVVAIVWAIGWSLDAYAAGLTVGQTILWLFTPLTNFGDTIWTVILVNIVMQLIWLGGIHGASVVNAVFLTVWLQYLDANAAAAAAGLALPHVTTLPFYQWFIWIGGSGCTLSFVLMLLRSRSTFLRQIGSVSLLPGICNINEPVIYGLPMVMNPMMAIPFILAPVVVGILSYAAVAWGWVHRFSGVLVPWTLPGPIGAYLATGWDWRAVVLVAVNMAVSAVIYWPFFKEYEKTLIAKEVAANVLSTH